MKHPTAHEWTEQALKAEPFLSFYVKKRSQGPGMPQLGYITKTKQGFRIKRSFVDTPQYLYFETWEDVMKEGWICD